MGAGADGWLVAAHVLRVVAELLGDGGVAKEEGEGLESTSSREGTAPNVLGAGSCRDIIESTRPAMAEGL